MRYRNEVEQLLDFHFRSLSDVWPQWVSDSVEATIIHHEIKKISLEYPLMHCAILELAKESGMARVWILPIKDGSLDSQMVYNSIHTSHPFSLLGSLLLGLKSSHLFFQLHVDTTTRNPPSDLRNNDFAYHSEITEIWNHLVKFWK